MIPRSVHRNRILALLRQFPVVEILGARQVGKTTLAAEVARASRGPTTVFDLEKRSDYNLLAEPEMILDGIRGLIVIDEIQRRPELFALLRVLADRPRGRARFLILGSASPTIVRGVSESLAGRVANYRLPGLLIDEVGDSHRRRLWERGGFPRSFLARTVSGSFRWRQDFIDTFIERDVPRLGFAIPAVTLHRLWSMLAHLHGQVLNVSDLGRSLGATDMTVRRYLDVLAGSFAVRLLLPWCENLAKRQVKAPKVYLADTGILHALLGIDSMDALVRHPRAGASWEGFCISHIIARLDARPMECHFWRTHAGAELDLLVVRGRRRLGFEIKYADSVRVTPSMRSALADLRLDRLDVIYPGRRTYPMAERIRAVAMADLLKEIHPLA